MPFPLEGVTGSLAVTRPASWPPTTGTVSTTPGGFAESLGRLIDSVEQTAGDANTAVAKMVDKSGEVHDAMIALQRAEMALQMTVQIRNKLVEAYESVMRMPI